MLLKTEKFVNASLQNSESGIGPENVEVNSEGGLEEKKKNVRTRLRS